MATAVNVVAVKWRQLPWRHFLALTSDKDFQLTTIQVSYNSIVCNSVEHRILCLETTIYGQHWFSVTIWRKLLQNRIEWLSKLTVSMLLVHHSALSGLKNSKVAILTWEMKNVEKFEDSELQALLDEDDAQTQQLADQLNMTRKAVSIRLKSMGKIQKMGKWVPHKLNERPKNHLRNAARQIQKKVISPSNCDWRWKVDIFWES